LYITLVITGSLLRLGTISEKLHLALVAVTSSLLGPPPISEKLHTISQYNPVIIYLQLHITSRCIIAMAVQFNLFPRFSPEIRETIWKQAAPGRIITITEIPYSLMATNFERGQAMRNNPSFPQFESFAEVPAILHTSQEARQAALKIYHLVFEGYCQNPFYFNPYADIVFLPTYKDFQAFSAHTHTCNNLQMIRYLALGRLCHLAFAVSRLCAQKLARLENLESLIIQTGDSLGTRDKFLVRKQLRGYWKKLVEEEGRSTEKKIVMANPDIVFLEPKQMEIMELFTPSFSQSFREQ
jgi:hypothetical protein